MGSFEIRKVITKNQLPLILERCHNSEDLGGHRGRDSTLFKAKQYYWWPNMTETAQDWINNCHECNKVL